jgi:hypothetical protein
VEEADHLEDRCKWEDIIKIGLKETGWEGVNVIRVAAIDFCEYDTEL